MAYWTARSAKALVQQIGQFGKYHNTLCLSPPNLHKQCFHFLLGLTMVPRENKSNAFAKFWRTDRVLRYFESGPRGGCAWEQHGRPPMTCVRGTGSRKQRISLPRRLRCWQKYCTYNQCFVSSLTCRLPFLLSSFPTRLFPLPFPLFAKLSNPPSTWCTWMYLSLVLTENVLAVSCCSATRGIRFMACRKFLNVSRSSLICLPLVGTLTISLKRPGSPGDIGFDEEPGKVM
mgnify:CR=1 FL=1